MKWVIELPLPYKECSPNFHGSWQARQRAVQSYRDEVAKTVRFLLPEFVKRGMGKLTPPLWVHLDYYLHNPAVAGGVRYMAMMGYAMPKDEDNARGCFKAGQDALVDAGVVPRDTKEFLRAGKTQIYSCARDHKGRHCLVLTLEEIEE